MNNHVVMSAFGQSSESNTLDKKSRAFLISFLYFSKFEFEGMQTKRKGTKDDHKVWHQWKNWCNIWVKNKTLSSKTNNTKHSSECGFRLKPLKNSRHVHICWTKHQLNSISMWQVVTLLDNRKQLNSVNDIDIYH